MPAAGASSAAKLTVGTWTHRSILLHDLVLSFRNPAKISARRIADYTHGARLVLVVVVRKEDPWATT